jgi:hypothetical protein
MQCMCPLLVRSKQGSLVNIFGLKPMPKKATNQQLRDRIALMERLAAERVSACGFTRDTLSYDQHIKLVLMVPLAAAALHLQLCSSCCAASVSSACC